MGPPGVWTIAAAIRKEQGNNDDVNKYLGMFKDAVDDVVVAANNGDNKSPKYGYDMTDNILMTGLAGEEKVCVCVCVWEGQRCPFFPFVARFRPCVVSMPL